MDIPTRVPAGMGRPSGRVTPPGGTRRGVREAAGEEYRRPSLMTADCSLRISIYKPVGLGVWIDEPDMIIALILGTAHVNLDSAWSFSVLPGDDGGLQGFWKYWRSWPCWLFQWYHRQPILLSKFHPVGLVWWALGSPFLVSESVDAPWWSEMEAPCHEQHHRYTRQFCERRTTHS